MTDTTKKYRKTYWILFAVDIIVLYLPFIIFLFKGFFDSSTASKAALGSLTALAAVFSTLNVLLKMHMKTPLWLLLLGIYIAIKNIVPLLVIVTISTLLDEIVLTPLLKAYKEKYSFNKQFDERIESNGSGQSEGSATE